MHTVFMWLESRRAVDQTFLSARRNVTNGMFRCLHWQVFVLALTIHGVSGATDYGNGNDDDYNSYYAFSDSDADYDSEEEERVHEMIVDEWYDLVRYLVGLGLCVSGLIGLYFHQFASYYFLKKYTRPRETERRIGRVVHCEPLLSSTRIQNKKAKKKRDQHPGIPVPTFRGEGGSATDYVRGDDLEWTRRQQGNDKPGGEFNDYRMLVMYKVPNPRSSSFLCCGPSTKTINCTTSFATCGSGLTEVDGDSTEEKINTYRSRSLPTMLKQVDSYADLSGKLSSSMDYMNGDSEYFQWFETSSIKTIDTEIDLILLKGQPKSACTPEVLNSHLAQVGKAHVGEEKGKHFQSVSLLGTGLAVAAVVISLVCVFEIQAMPNPETQRPLGYMVLGGFLVGSIISGYLCAKLLFEQYKQKVFLSAFKVPSIAANRTRRYSHATDSSNIYDDETFTEDDLRMPIDIVATAATVT